MPRLTAVVPATDRPPQLARVRTAIERAADPPEEVIVAELPAGASPSLARNEAARRAGGDVLVFVDSDVVVHPDAFQRIRAAFRADPDVTAVFGSYDDTPECSNIVSGFRNLLHHRVHQQAAGDAETFWTGLGAIRRDAFLASGGFDAGRFGEPSVEDVELGMRLRAAGARIVLDPELQGTHLKTWSLAGMLRTDLRARALPWVRVLLRRRTLPGTLNLAWRHRLSAVGTLLAGVLAATGSLLPAAAVLSLFVAGNSSFYALVWRRRGPVAALCAIPLHVLHYLVALVAVPLGVAMAARSWAEHGPVELDALEPLPRDAEYLPEPEPEPAPA